MSYPKHVKWVTRPGRKTVLVTLISLVALLVAGFLVVQATGGIQQLAALIDQAKAQPWPRVCRYEIGWRRAGRGPR